MRARLPVAAGVLLAMVVSALYAFNSQGGGLDYSSDAGPAIDALAHGDVGGFLAQPPLMGSFSLLLRAPLAALATIDDASQLLVFRLGALPCLLAAGLVAVWVERLMAERGRPLGWRLVVAGAFLVNPLTIDALRWGHPEEYLGAALCIGAVIAATRDRWLVAAVLLGLAGGTKQWAILAALPVLLAASHRRIAIVLVAGAIVAALTLPYVVAAPDAFNARTGQAAHSDAAAGSKVTALNVWWPLATEQTRTVNDGVGEVTVSTFKLSPELASLTHPLIVVLALPLSALFWLRRRELERADALGLLALLFLGRCLFDPLDFPYYAVPFLLSLAAWDGLRRRGPPLATLWALGGLYLTIHVSGYATMNAVFLGWTLPLAAWIALMLYAPATSRSLGQWVKTSLPSSLTTTRSSIRTPNSPAT